MSKRVMKSGKKQITERTDQQNQKELIFIYCGLFPLILVVFADLKPLSSDNAHLEP